ncbi:hypothetical protein FZEAL_9613 [Fusarium zealandicum]|uniref:Uncharacterized protein n=1 Tax=Fusarium zealandicum TaxID=1053134 RepID=A0A8H4XFN3_9HYPO|nr:hypothetical protein FZEAL_9613 [Fusarium zealandicum]
MPSRSMTGDYWIDPLLSHWVPISRQIRCNSKASQQTTPTSHLTAFRQPLQAGTLPYRATGSFTNSVGGPFCQKPNSCRESRQHEAVHPAGPELPETWNTMPSALALALALAAAVAAAAAAAVPFWARVEATVPQLFPIGLSAMPLSEIFWKRATLPRRFHDTSRFHTPIHHFDFDQGQPTGFLDYPNSHRQFNLAQGPRTRFWITMRALCPWVRRHTRKIRRDGDQGCS